MNQLRRRRGIGGILVLLLLVTVVFTACAKDTQGVLPAPVNQEQNNSAEGPDNAGENTGTTDPSQEPGTDTNQPPSEPSGSNDGDSAGDGTTGDPGTTDEETQPDGSGQVDFSDAHSVAVLVNKEYALPEDYEPSDLVYPDVRFTFSEKIDKRKMRSEAAAALEKMFAGAEEDGIYLAGVSAYRSHSTQTSLFNRYVKKDGLEKAKTYSAVPGHSEHETGLAIDVSGSDGKCAAEDCFGDTKEAEWLAKHATEYGFIIRYPEGKEDITGYKYEPWHLRYVGTEIAADIAEREITLEEYYNAVPVSANP